MTDLTKLSQAELIALVQAAQAAASAPRKLTMKVTAKREDGKGTDGALSIYGLGRFPVTLYYEQWQRLLGTSEELKKFLEENKDKLKLKNAE